MLTKIERHNVCDLCCPRSPRASTWSRRWSPCVGPGRQCIDSVIPSSLGIRQSLSYWSQNSQHNPNIFSFPFELLKSVTLVLTNTRAIYLSKHEQSHSFITWHLPKDKSDCGRKCWKCFQGPTGNQENILNQGNRFFWTVKNSMKRFILCNRLLGKMLSMGVFQSFSEWKAKWFNDLS